jgi:hypothetical protein
MRLLQRQQRALRSFGSASTTSKAKNTKEKDKKEKEDEKAKLKPEEGNHRATIEVVNDLGKKGSKTKTDGNRARLEAKAATKAARLMTRRWTMLTP